MSLAPRWGFGLSSPQVLWADANTLVYLSGNSVIAHNIASRVQHIAKSLGLGITCFTLNRKYGLVAFSERGEGYHPHIRVCRLPEFGGQEFRRLATVDATHGDAEVLVDYSALAFSSDGRLLAACGGAPAPAVTVWDWTDHRPVATVRLDAPATFASFDPFQRSLLCVSTPRGSTLVRVDAEGDAAGGHQSAALDSGHGAAVAHAWAGRGLLLCGTDRGRLVYTRVEEAAGRLSQSHFSPPDVAASGPITRLDLNAAFAFCSVEGSAQVHVLRRTRLSESDEESDAGENDLMRGGMRTSGRAGAGEGVAFEETLEPAGAGTAPSGVRHLAVGGPDHAVLLAVCRGGHMLTGVTGKDGSLSLHPLLDFHTGPIRAVCPLSDSVVATVDANGRVARWETDTFAPLSSAQAGGGVTCVAHSPATRTIAVGASSGVLRLYRADAGGGLTLSARFKLHPEAVARVCLSPAGDCAASVSSDSKLYFTQAAADGTWRAMGYATPPDPVLSMCWPDAGAVPAPLLLMTAAGEVVWVQTPPRDAQAGRDHRLPTKHAPMKRMRIDHLVVAAAGVPGKDMPSILGLTGDRHLQMYAVPKELQSWSTTGARGGRLHAPERSVVAHDRAATSIAVAPDRDHLLTTCEDGSVRIWGPGLTVTLPVSEGHHLHSQFTGGCTAAAFARRGTLVVTGGQDGTVLVSVLHGIQMHIPPDADMSTPLPIPAPIDDVEDTEGEKDAAELFAAQMDATAKARAEPATRKVLERVEELRRQLASCIERNKLADASERLTEDELVVNRSLLARLEAEAAEEVGDVKRRIERRDMEREVVRARILRRCWDAMATKPATVCAVRSSARVHNFPITHASRMTRVAAKLLLLRKAEAAQRKHLGLDDWSAKLRTAEVPPDIAGATAATGPAAPMQPAPSLASAITAVGLPNGPAHAHSGVELPAAAVAASGSSEGEGDDDRAVVKGSEDCMAGMRDEGDGMQGIMYAPMDLLARSRRVIQVYLLALRVVGVKAEFNRRFEQVVSEKHAELERVAEVNARIRDVVADLARLSGGAARADADAGATPAMDPEEDPSWMLRVSDTEVQVERFLTREERERVEAQRAEEEARRAALARDNAAERALKEMMGGTLDRAESEDESLALVRPAFMDMDPAKWTDEQKKAAQEYKAREVAVKEERDKRVMGLETELRGAKSMIEEILLKVDKSVETLRSERVRAEFAVAVLERRMVRVAEAADALLELSAQREQELVAEVARADTARTKKSTEVIEAREDAAAHARLADQAQAEDRQQEKQFRRDFQEVSDYLPALTALYRKRVYLAHPAPDRGPQRGLSRRLSRRASLASHHGGASKRASSRGLSRGPSHGRASRISEDSEAGSPGAHAFESVVGGYANAEDPAPSMGALDPHPGAGAEPVTAEHVAPLGVEECPPGLESAWWERLLAAREAKIETEKRLRRAQEVLSSKQSRLARLVAQEAALSESVSRASETLDEFRARREALLYDFEIPLLLKQGQVEARPAEGEDVLRDGELIHAGNVQAVNREIREQGQRKIDILVDIKEFKRGIYELEWENRRLAMEAEDMKERTRELQLLRVTKELQEALKSNGGDAGGGQVTNLEKLTKHSARLHAKRMDEKRRQMGALERAVAERQGQNEDLEERLRKMEQLVGKEGRILQSKTLRHNAGGASLISRRMRSLVTKARLRDISRQQAEEIEMLVAEVDRLRSRTFPTFVTVVHDSATGV